MNSVEQGWQFGAFKSLAKWQSQLTKRGWTTQQITEAVENGEKFTAKNLINKDNTATRYVHPKTGRSVVIDDVTKEVIHVGGNDFKY
jgi:predicted RNA-binding protein (virulence factor B family)